MALFRVYRKDSIGYDEYDSVVVRARNADQARELVLTKYYELHLEMDGEPKAYHGFSERNIEVDRIDTIGPPEEICVSFKAG